MVRTVALSILALAALAAGPAAAQVHDGIDQSPAQQRTADEFRDAGSACTAPACRNDPDGVYPPAPRPGEAAGTSAVAGRPQN